jgi:hypothetical protein
MSRTVVRPVEMQMRTLLIAALTLATAIMAARAFSEIPRESVVGGESIAQGGSAGPQPRLPWQFIDDGY